MPSVADHEGEESGEGEKEEEADQMTGAEVGDGQDEEAEGGDEGDEGEEGQEGEEGHDGEEGQHGEGGEEEEREVDQEVSLKDALGDFIPARTKLEEKESLEEVFAYLTEGRARISPADLAIAVERMGVKVSKVLLQEVILEATGGNSVNLAPSEFAAMMQKFEEKDLNDELKEIWILAGGETPVNELARLSQASLGKALQSLGVEMSEDEVASLVIYAGGEENELDYEQFVRLLAPFQGDAQ